MIVLNVTSTKVGAEMRQKKDVNWGLGRNYQEGQNKSKLKNFNRTNMEQFLWLPQNAALTQSHLPGIELRTLARESLDRRVSADMSGP